MNTRINTRSKGEVEFFVPHPGGYVYADLNGQPGTLGNQVCEGGRMSGNTLSFGHYKWDDFCEADQERFNRFCRNWWAAHLRRQREV